MEALSSRVLLHPVDFDRSENFYRNALGLGVYREFGAGEHRGVVFFLGGGFLELSGQSSGPPGGNIELWLQVRDLADAYRSFTDHGVTVVRGPKREEWGLDELWIEDPDGLRIAVIEVPADHPLRRDSR